MEKDLEKIYGELYKLIKKYSKGLKLYDEVEGSTAKDKKKQIHLCGKEDKIILNSKKPKRVYINSIMMHKDFVGFYSMAIYSHSKEFKLSPELSKMQKGKSCINVNKLDKNLLKEIESIIKKGIDLYKKEGWI